MYLRWLTRLLSDYQSFPLTSLSLRVPSSLRPQVSTPIQCRRASPCSPCQRSLFCFPLLLLLRLAYSPLRFDPPFLPIHTWSHPYRIDHISTFPTSLSLICLATHCEILHLIFLSRYTGDLVYVSTVDLSLPKGRASKLLPKYVGPFKILDVQPSVSTYKVELPTQLRARNLHDRFHWSKLRPYYANNNASFPHHEAHMFYDFGTPDDQEWLVEEILSHQWDKNRLSFQIL